jgi:predicted GIY-YIG superfamily endonuclease
MRIYRLYGSDDSLLYIGASSDVPRRVREHRRKHWGDRERNARNRAEARRQRDTYIAAALGRAS